MRNMLSFLRSRHDWRLVRLLLLALVLASACGGGPLAAQPLNSGQGGAGGQQGAGGTTGQGGAANADFDSLIDLIVSTVSTETWAENGGGEAEIRPFFGGVLVDAKGTLQLRSRTSESGELATKRGDAPAPSQTGPRDARRASALRYISLPRLEREIARRQAAGKPLEPAMLTMAGLQRVRYVFLYPESGDLVLAGPAGDWEVNAEGRIVSTDAGQPVVRLDDLLALLRRGPDAAESFFGCSINPRQDALAKTQAFLAASSQRPVKPGRRARWLGALRDSVGQQDIEIFGIDPASRVAGVLVEADYHMKLVGMGLADGVEGVESYLDAVKRATERAGKSAPPPMSVLRWWFTLHYESIAASPAGDAYELVGQGVRVLSENELLAAQGRRVHTGQSEPLNRQFAERFTTNFSELAAKYPVYGELRNIFDLAMAVSLIHTERLIERSNWQPGLFASGEQLRLPEWPVPRQVETVVSHRIVNRRHILAGVSGGVMVSPSDELRELRTTDNQIVRQRIAAPPANLADAFWWWDAAE